MIQSDEERARKILAAMERVKPREAGKRSYVWFMALLSLALIVAIVILVVTNREKFTLIWNHLIRPDSLPGAGD